MPTGPEDPRCLRNPAVRVAPDDRAVFAHRQIERCIAERGSLCITVDERERDVELPLKHRRAGVLSAGVVETDRMRTTLGEPRREITGSAPEFDDIETIEV